MGSLFSGAKTKNKLDFYRVTDSFEMGTISYPAGVVRLYSDEEIDKFVDEIALTKGISHQEAVSFACKHIEKVKIT